MIAKVAEKGAANRFIASTSLFGLGIWGICSLFPDFSILTIIIGVLLYLTTIPWILNGDEDYTSAEFAKKIVEQSNVDNDLMEILNQFKKQGVDVKKLYNDIQPLFHKIVHTTYTELTGEQH